MMEPIWYDYVVWDYSDPTYPVPKGVREDTPPDIRKQFEEDMKDFLKARGEGKSE